MRSRGTLLAQVRKTLTHVHSYSARIFVYILLSVVHGSSTNATTSHLTKNNVLALAASAKYFNLPTILTTSLEQGPNGPILPELKAMFPEAPFIPRPGQINAWDSQEFVAAVQATGKKQLIIAGIVTDVCVAFPALSAINEGFEVFVAVDASGTFNAVAREAAHKRMAAAGVQLLNWFAIACELHRDWRNDMEGLGALFAQHIPDYSNLISSYAAQHIATASRR